MKIVCTFATWHLEHVEHCCELFCWCPSSYSLQNTWWSECN